jgi:hypothetical protein
MKEGRPAASRAPYFFLDAVQQRRTRSEDRNSSVGPTVPSAFVAV